ncbi:MAG: hypothetical protein ACRC2T_12950 [Thermoguttaceae bacterium]
MAIISEKVMENMEHVQVAFFLLIVFAISFAIWQTRSLSFSLRQLKDNDDVSKGEEIFLRRQYRRRIQISILIGLCGICMFAGMGFSPAKSPNYFVFSWALAILFIFWTMILACLDFFSIKMHYKRISNKNIAEEMKLKYQLEQEMKKREDEKKE